MQYINYKRFKGKAICGYVNIPALTNFQAEDGMIYYNEKPLCTVVSSNAHNFFARNDDGCGLQRGRLIETINKMLSKRDAFYQIRWNAVWEDAICNQYRRIEHQDYWLWNHAFYNAPIEQLEHIVSVIKNAK